MMRRSMWLASLAVVVAVVVVASTASAATRATTAGPDPSKTGTLKLAWISELRPGMEALVKNFNNAYPNVKVEATYTPFSTYTQLVPTQLQAGNGPDLMWLTPGFGITSVYPLGSQGRLLDLSGSPWQKRIPASARKPFKVKERYYAAPIATLAFNWTANTDVLQAAGVSVPTTFQQVLNLCAKVKAAGKIPIVMSTTSMGNYIQQAAINWVYRVDPQWSLHKSQGKVSFATSAGWRKVFDAVVQMKNAGCFAPDITSGTTASTDVQFTTGQAALNVSGTTGMGRWRAINPNIKVAGFWFPGDTAKTTIAPISPAVAIAINKVTSNVALSKLFVNFVSRPKQGDVYATIGGSLTSAELRTGNMRPELTAMGPVLKQQKTMLLPNIFWPNGTLDGRYRVQMLGLFTGQTTVDSILKWADDNWKP